MTVAMEKRLPVSVCMIAGAEAARIGPALASVADWASEIIVVLNEEVADGTERVAAEQGAKVFRETWKGYAAQKNSAAQKAGQEWLLGLDADEVVSRELRREIELVLTEPMRAERYAAFSVPRLTKFCGRWIRHGDWYPDRQTRLWRRGRAQWGGLEPHAKLEVDGAVGRLRGDLLHYTCENLERSLAKTMAYARDFVRNCEAEKRTVGYLDMILRPGWRFIRGYVFRLGFLDGWQGASVAWLGALYTFVRYAKVLEARQQRQEPR